MMKIYLYIAMTLFLAVSFSPVLAEEKVYSLQDAYQSVIGTNEILKIAEEGISQSEFRVDQAKTYLYPRIVARSAYTKYNDTLPPGGGPVIFQPSGQFSAALVVTQPLYTGGRTFAALRTTEKMLDQSKKGLTVAQQDIMLKVTEAYYGVLKAQKSLEISRRSLDRLERHKKVTEKEAAARMTKANVTALLRAKTLENQAQIGIVRAADGLQIAREKLSMLTKLPADAKFKEPDPLPVPAENLEKLKTAALAEREDYASAKLSQGIATENITIVRGAHYPQIYAEAGITYLSSDPTTLLDATSYYGGLRLQIPLFEGGLMRAEVAEARSKLRQADLATTLLQRSIESEIYEAFTNLRTTASVLDTARIQLKYAKENFEAVEGMFAEGLVNSLSLIDAEQALSSSERELMIAAYDQQVNIQRLRKSIGILGKK